MAHDYNVADITADGGGEGSTTGNTLIYKMPSTKSNGVAKLKRLIIDNATGANGRLLFDFDSDDTSTAMGSVADLAVEVGANETVFLTENDFGEIYITSGVVAQASNGATSNGYKVRIEVDVLP